MKYTIFCKTLFTVLVFTCSNLTNIVFADEPPPPPNQHGSSEDLPPGGGVTLDGGLLILVFSAGIYGIRRKKRNSGQYKELAN